MIIGILAIIFVIATIICWCIFKIRYSFDTYEEFYLYTILLTIFTVFFSAFVGADILHVKINEDIDYQSALYEKEVIEYRIDNMSDNIVGNEMLYNDVVEFNNELRRIKKWANNPWVSWFYNQKIASIDYIEIGE